MNYILLYIIITIFVFRLMYAYEVDKDELNKYIGKFGVLIFIIIFFIPLVINLVWYENWDCIENEIDRPYYKK